MNQKLEVRDLYHVATVCHSAIPFQIYIIPILGTKLYKTSVTSQESLEFSYEHPSLQDNSQESAGANPRPVVIGGAACWIFILEKAHHDMASV